MLHNKNISTRYVKNHLVLPDKCSKTIWFPTVLMQWFHASILTQLSGTCQSREHHFYDFIFIENQQLFDNSYLECLRLTQTKTGGVWGRDLQREDGRVLKEKIWRKKTKCCKWLSVGKEEKSVWMKTFMNLPAVGSDRQTVSYLSVSVSSTWMNVVLSLVWDHPENRTEEKDDI